MNRLGPWLAAAALGLFSTLLPAADQIGEVRLAHGVVTAYSEGGTARIVGRAAPLYVGDVVATSARSMAQLQLNDGTRIILRPNSSFELTAFSTVEDAESAIFTLFRGGLRSVTGFLSKRNRNAMKLRTSVATIGIRGTEFDVRLCEQDCATEAARRPEPAGRAGFVRGRVLARAEAGRARTLKNGDPVYVGDRLISGASAYAVLAFRDQSRVTLLPNTEFRVDELKFNTADPAGGSAVFRLFRGGLRAVSGLIGKGNGGRGYRLRTSVATIGIRGTGYDAVCQGTCENPDPGAGPDGDGLFVEPWQDTIVLDGVTEVPQGQVVFVANSSTPPVTVPSLPFTINEPQPQTVTLPPPPPPPSSSSTPQAGVYVACYVGNCAVETEAETVELGPGDAGYVNEGGAAEALEEIPPFQAEDQALLAVERGEGGGRLGGILDSEDLQCIEP